MTTNSINALLSYTHKTELYIVVVFLQKKDDHQQQNKPAVPNFFINKSGED